jgi:hypothetical protein
VAGYLRTHPSIEKVGYLGFLEDGSPQADIYARQCAGPGSTISVYVKGGEAEAFRFLDRLVLIKLAVSLGGTESLASHPAAMTHIAVPEERKKRFGLLPNLVRISISPGQRKPVGMKPSHQAPGIIARRCKADASLFGTDVGRTWLGAGWRRGTHFSCPPRETLKCLL